MKSTGYIVGGIYYKKPPRVQELKEGTQSTYKHWDHDRQRENHRKDLVQPHNRDGTVNQEFVTLYPEESKAYGFIPDKEV